MTKHATNEEQSNTMRNIEEIEQNETMSNVPEPEIKHETSTVETLSNPFVFAQNSESKSESRTLDYTPALINKSNIRASELMKSVTKDPDWIKLAERMMQSGDAQDLIDLIEAVYDSTTIKTDSMILEGCDDNQLNRLLSSRQSDRSKAKTKGLKADVRNCKTYISSMYAEILIRTYWKKPYSGSSNGTTDIEAIKDDQDALSRKVKSLQSKKCRLAKLASYDAEARRQLADVDDEIERLNALRPTVRIKTKIVVVDPNTETIRNALKDIDINSLPEAEQAKLLALMAKIG